MWDTTNNKNALPNPNPTTPAPKLLPTIRKQNNSVVSRSMQPQELVARRAVLVKSVVARKQSVVGRGGESSAAMAVVVGKAKGVKDKEIVC